MEQQDKLGRPKRPRSVTFLALGVLIIGALFWTRFAQAVQLREFIQALEPGVSVGYLAATGLIFGAVSLPAAAGLWLGKPWAAPLTQGFFGGLAAWYWLDKILLVTAETVTGNWTFALAATALVLAVVQWTLSRPFAKYLSGNSEAGRK